jgi:hypothetical protein
MDPRLPPDDRSFAIANPRGGALPDCETALAAAGHALTLRTDPIRELTRAADVLRQAGWTSALRLAETLILTAPRVTEGGAPRAIFDAALRAFTAAIKRRNLNELACSPTLFEHYRHLSMLLAGDDRVIHVSLDDLALAARPVPAATLSPLPRPDAWFHLRSRYERALLPVLRAHADDAPALLAQVDSCLDELDACMAELVGPDPYDMWRLAAGALQSLRALQNAGDAAQAHAKWVIARLNLLLAEHARGGSYAAPELVRATLAAVWQPLALGYDLSADAKSGRNEANGVDAADGGSGRGEASPMLADVPPRAAQASLLRDYGISAAYWTSNDSDATALWEAPHGLAGSMPGGGVDDPGYAASVESLRVASAGADRTARTSRRVGPLLIDANAYEDFLQVADASMAELNEEARSEFAASGVRGDPFAAFRAAEAAYRLGAHAWALGLGSLAILADALGLGWRRIAHGASGASPQTTVSPKALYAASEALRRLLHQIAAGIPPSDPAAALYDLASAIEGSRRVGGL